MPIVLDPCKRDLIHCINLKWIITRSGRNFKLNENNLCLFLF
ncbi:hypothetical protein Bhyg_11912 [Pseudolycoriella hygida]|uniref:Uncharacterized protein n=1 Tax=Pseudolycoriella hygida TaxID=35572 RepID=A0A9Q0MWB3_9DIPT|nr:hypothetical protein Bhyg_11912 [Pseudolycoriella hygida]